MNRIDYHCDYKIVLTNEGLNYDGTDNLQKTSDGFVVHRFAQSIVLPKFCKLKWVNLTINEIPSEKELYLCIKELPNKCYIGDGVNGRNINGFLGLVNHLDTTSNVFSNLPYIYLKNTEPMPLQQMTLEIYTNNGKSSNFSSDIIIYNLNEGNNWTSTGTGGVYEFRQNITNQLQWEAINIVNNNIFNIYFDKDNPAQFTTDIPNLTGYYDIDTITPSPDVGKLIFSNGSHWETALAPALVSKTDLKSKYALELQIQQDKKSLLEYEELYD